MIDERLYCETFSKLRASDEVKREVINRMESQNRKTRSHRPWKVAGMLAALVAALCVTANAATDGGLLRTFSIIWNSGDAITMKAGDGSTATAQLLRAAVEKVDGRLLLTLPDRELDITDALERDGYYCYESKAGKVEVSGDAEHWTVTQTAGGGDVSYSVVTDSENDPPVGTITLPDGPGSAPAPSAAAD